MLKRSILTVGAALILALTARAQSTQVELANLREDVRGLVQRVGELTLRVEALERQNAELREKLNAGTPAYATLEQLNDAVTELRRAIAAGDSATAERAATQIKRLGDATNAAIDSLAKGMATRPTVTTFNENYPKEGVSYTVQKGDTLALIAKKTGAKSQDIINANKIVDPSRIQVGQTLFIPTGPAK
ncbi:MAG TPA: LysM peptidoglycan-binding domain-containing protein [Opitutaceae bacterium]|nr:LysM peptidoglycan-binding domain-containing protein [Opitutaceae bacterium]HND60439.1 LysM peptidoglycan-binding domain-containing protein [Opitutaceae bacterium]